MIHIKKCIKANINNWYEWLQINNYMNLDNSDILINQIKKRININKHIYSYIDQLIDSHFAAIAI